jgi:hypothetical protein
MDITRTSPNNEMLEFKTMRAVVPPSGFHRSTEGTSESSAVP